MCPPTYGVGVDVPLVGGSDVKIGLIVKRSGGTPFGWESVGLVTRGRGFSFSNGSETRRLYGGPVTSLIHGYGPGLFVGVSRGWRVSVQEPNGLPDTGVILRLFVGTFDGDHPCWGVDRLVGT